MHKERIEEVLDSLIEALANVEHERWAHWQRFMHSMGIRQPDGSLLIPGALVDKWEKQINTAYAELKPNEKESDREQVRRYLPMIVSTLIESQGRE